MEKNILNKQYAKAREAKVTPKLRHFAVTPLIKQTPSQGSNSENYSSLLPKLPSEEATIFAILNCKDLSKSIHKLEGFRI